MTPEEIARQQIDRMLDAAGWKVQDLRDLNLGATLGVAVREFPLQSGEADYLLFVDRQAAGVVEAKPEGTTLTGVAEQSTRYLVGVPANLPHVQEPLPFGYESTGVETFFRDLRDPDPRSRRGARTRSGVGARHSPPARGRPNAVALDHAVNRPGLIVGMPCPYDAATRANADNRPGSIVANAAPLRPRRAPTMRRGGPRCHTIVSSTIAVRYASKAMIIPRAGSISSRS